MLERPVMTPVEIDQQRHNLTERQGRLARPLALAPMQQAPVIEGRKGLAEIVDIAEDSNQLVHRGSLGCGADSWQNQPSIREPLAFATTNAYPELTLLLDVEA